MKVFRRYPALPLLLLLITCQQDKPSTGGHLVKLQRQYFAKTINYVGVGNVGDDFLVNPSDIGLVDNQLIVLDRYSQSGLLLLLDKGTLQPVAASGKAGSGPGEYLGLKKISTTRKNAYAYDLSGNKLTRLNIDSLLSKPNYVSEHVIRLKNSRNVDIEAVTDSLFVVSYYGSDPRLHLINWAQDSILSFLEYPDLINKYRLDFFDFKYNARANIYQARLASNATDKVALCYYFTSLLQIADIYHNRVINIVGPDTNFPPDYIMAGGKSVLPKDAIYGYLDIYATEEFVYALYYGEKYDVFQSSEIFQFTWTGEPVAIIRLNKPIKAFAVDERDDTIYGISHGRQPIEKFLPRQ